MISHASLTAPAQHTVAPEPVAGLAGGPIFIYLPCFSGGGAERVFLRLAGILAKRGFDIQLIVNTDTGPLKEMRPADTPLHVLGSAKSILSLWPLVRLIRLHRPRALISALTGINLNAAMAVRLSGVETRLLLNERNHFSAYLQRLGWAQRLYKRWAARTFYPTADLVVGNTRDLTEDLAAVLDLDKSKVRFIPNPAPNAAEIEAARRSQMPHPWFEHEVPVAVAMARLKPQKDYPTMLRAMQRMEGKLRLIVLGEGPEHRSLDEMIDAMNLRDTVTLVGFRMNRFDYLVRARLLLLSSIAEGFPNALIEAAACGVHCISTDCHGGGAREILGDVFPDCIVPIGDEVAFANAISTQLGKTPDMHRLTALAEAYSLDVVVDRFIHEISQ